MMQNPSRTSLTPDGRRHRLGPAPTTDGTARPRPDDRRHRLAPVPAAAEAVIEIEACTRLSAISTCSDCALTVRSGEVRWSGPAPVSRPRCAASTS